MVLASSALCICSFQLSLILLLLFFMSLHIHITPHSSLLTLFFTLSNLDFPTDSQVYISIVRRSCLVFVSARISRQYKIHYCSMYLCFTLFLLNEFVLYEVSLDPSCLIHRYGIFTFLNRSQSLEMRMITGNTANSLTLVLETLVHII